MLRTAASVQALTQLKDIDLELAHQIRHIWRTARKAELQELSTRLNVKPGDHWTWYELRRRLINRIASYHGVEFLGIHRRTGLDVYYLNAGDSYTPTICFHGGAMRVATMASWVESNAIRPVQ